MLLCLLILAIGISFVFLKNIRADVITTSVTVTSAPLCGNGTIDSGEGCDGSAFGDETCVSQGFDGGSLSCTASCTINTSDCTSDGGGGGGGGGGPPQVFQPTVTKVILQGKAYPFAAITVLKDGQVMTITEAGGQADFKVEVTDVTAGIYTFGVWAEDKNGIKSITFNFTVNVVSGAQTTVSGIFIPPTIDLNKDTLTKGEVLGSWGYTAPQSIVEVRVASEEEVIEKIQADDRGSWLYKLDTEILEEGSHNIRAKSTSAEGLLSTFSKTLSFFIGGVALEGVCPGADFNKDGKVNLIDFSILLFWWGRSDPCADQNQDGIAGITDFSIMMYWWTG